MGKRKQFQSPKCNDKRFCFAKDDDTGNCEILDSTYDKGVKCPFCKPFRNKDMNGNDYPPELRRKMKELHP